MSTPNQPEKVAYDQAGVLASLASNLLVSFKYALADSATPCKLNAISRTFEIIGAGDRLGRFFTSATDRNGSN